MPEFERRWERWEPEKLPADVRQAPDRTDESPSVSFVSSIAQGSGRRKPVRRSVLHCLIGDCQFDGVTVELGNGLTTRLCGPHRRELFRLARTHEAPAADATSPLLEGRMCRFCDRLVSPEDDPCRTCVARHSPLVQTALRLGASPLCFCGKPVSQAGETCEQCQEESAGRERESE